MKNKTICIDSIMLELSRRCNAQCGHCLRGNPQRKDMSYEVICAVISKAVKYGISRIIMGGGEPALAGAGILNLARALREYPSVRPGMFSFVTNATRRFSDDVLDAMQDVCGKHGELTAIVSNDQYHPPANARVIESLRDYAGIFINKQGGIEYVDQNRLLFMGRNKSIDARAVCVYPYDMIGNDNYVGDEWLFYVDVDGNVWPSCDLSYRFMRMRKDMRVGNVLDPDFDYVKAAAAFNLRHKFPLFLHEPGEFYGTEKLPYELSEERLLENAAASSKMLKRCRANKTKRGRDGQA